MNSTSLIFPVDLPEKIKCEAQIQDLLYPELDWVSGNTRVYGHTAIVFLNPSKVLKLIPNEKVKFFDVRRMKNVIRDIKANSFWLPPIQFDESLPKPKQFKLPNGSHRTILMSRNGINSVPYLTCDHMVENLIKEFGAEKINPKFDLTGLAYPVNYGLGLVLRDACWPPIIHTTVQ
jgi:hypothetical protein